MTNDDLEQAKKRLVHAVMSVAIDPAKLPVSAYINGIMNSARTSAICEFLTEPYEVPVDSEGYAVQGLEAERMDLLTIKHMEKLAETFEKLVREAPVIQVASSLAVN